MRAGVDVDFLIALNLQTPREIPATRAATTCIASISGGLIAIEVKQLDVTRFERIGDQLYPIYPGKSRSRSPTDQARDAAYDRKNFAMSSGYGDLYIQALAWLTQVDVDQLDGVDPSVIGRSDWASILTAACRHRMHRFVAKTIAPLPASARVTSAQRETRVRTPESWSSLWGSSSCIVQDGFHNSRIGLTAALA